jgi:molybdopterin-guanine dinucleotide biosynthesis protein A
VAVPPPSLHLSAIVLAGGRSSRMGAPKAALDWHGTSLLRRVTGVLMRLADPVVVVHAPGQELPELPEGVLLAVDEQPGRGPLEGIAAGMRALHGRADAAFVSSTDAPFLHPAFVRGVAAALDGADAVLPVAGGHNHPLAALYRLSLLPAVEQLLSEQRMRPFYLFETANTRMLDEPQLQRPESLRNVNTPEEYRAALAEPQPAVTVEVFGTLRAPLGIDRTVVRAATLGGAIDALPGLADISHHVLVALNGEQFQADRSVPLVDGDVLSVLTAEAGG